MQGQQQRALRWQARGAATRRAPRGSVLRRAAARPLVVVAKKSVETIRVESGASNNTLLGHWRQMAGMDTTVVPVEPGVHLAGLHEHVSVNMEGIPVPINTHGEWLVPGRGLAAGHCGVPTGGSPNTTSSLV